MKDLEFKGIFGRDNTVFYKKALFDEFWKNEKSVAEEVLAKAKDTDDFIELYLGDERVKSFYARNKIAREYRPEVYWKTIRGFIGDQLFKTDSDAGSVKIGNGMFSLLIPNGRGDGITRVAVVDDGSGLRGLEMNYFTTITGEFDVFDYDCGENSVMNLDGKYAVYYYDGFVVFSKEK